MVTRVNSSLPKVPPKQFFTKPVIVVIALAVLTALVVVVIRSLQGRVQPIADPKELYDKGSEFLKNNNPADAIREFTAALQKNPNPTLKAEILADRGLAHHHNQQPEEALKDLNDALNCNPENGLRRSIYFLQANIHVQQQDYIRSVETYTKALECKPSKDDKALILWRRGEQHFARDLIEDAIADLTAADGCQSSDPNVCAEILTLLGEVFATTNRPAEALEKFEQALKHNPNDHDLLRRIYLDRQKLFQKDDPKKAIQECTLALNYTPSESLERAGVLLELANLYFVLEDSDKTLEKLTEANQCNITDPNLSATILYQRAQIYKLRREFELAVTDLSKAIYLKPANNLGQLQSLLGQVCADQEKFSEAIHNYQAAMKLAPPKGEDRAQLLRLEAQAWTQLGNFIKPILCLNEALECEFDNEELKIMLRDGRGFAHLRNGDFEKANEDFSVILKSEGVNEKYKASLLYDRGLFFQESNKPEDARQVFEAALRYKFDDEELRQDIVARLKEVTPTLFSSVKGWLIPKLPNSTKDQL